MGGAENVASATHCATRLRVSVVDTARVDEPGLRALAPVLGVARLAEQVQIVVGPGRVDAIDRELQGLLGASRTAPTLPVETPPAETPPADEPRTEPSRADAPAAPAPRTLARRLARPVYVLMDIITPLLPLFVAAGMLLALHNLLGVAGMFGPFSAVQVVPWLSGFAALIGILGIGVFTLLPVFVGFSAASRFGASAYLGAAMGAALVTAPHLVDSGMLPALQLEGGGSWAIAGVDVLGIDYQGTVVPMIAVAYVLAIVERTWRRVLRGAANFLLVPMLTLLVTGVLAFLLIGPIMRWLGDTVADTIATVYEVSGVLGGAVFGAVYPLLVVTGTHQSLVSLELSMLAGGGSFIFPAAGVANLAQAGACFAVALLVRRRSPLRALSAGAGIPACFGIAEPAIFGVTLRLQFPFVAAVIASAVGGALLAAWRVQAVTLGAAGLLGVASIAPGSGMLYLACAAVGAVIAFVLTLVWGRILRARGSTWDQVDLAGPRAGAAGTLEA